VTFWAGYFCHFPRLKIIVDSGDKMTPYPIFFLRIHSLFFLAAGPGFPTVVFMKMIAAHMGWTDFF
jgi:hypothetical protein